MEKQISELIEKFYDIGTVSDVTEILGGFNNRGFRTHTLKGSDSNTYFVRQYKAGMARKEVQFEHALIIHTIEKGLTLCADVVPARNGETLVQPANSDKLFAVFEYLSGEDKYTWYSTALTDTEFRNAAGVLAEFHSAAHDFAPGRLKRVEPQIVALLPIIARNFIDLGQNMNESEFRSYYKANLDAVLEAIAQRADDD